MRIPEDTERRIKENLTFAQVLHHVGATTHRAGTNQIETLCPNHEDTKPSLTINTAKNICKCFVCGWGTDAVGLLQKYRGIGYRDALEQAAHILGIAIEQAQTATTPKAYRPTRWAQTPPPQPAPPQRETPPDYFSASEVARQEQVRSNNGLWRHMCAIFGEQATAQAWSLYKVGGANLWGGSVVFWQHDTAGRARFGKIVEYAEDGKRKGKKKEGAHHADHADVTTAAAVMKKSGNYRQVLFGAHLLAHADFADNIVNIVESEKTALYCHIAFGGLWLATCGEQSGARIDAAELLPHLRRRTIRLHPDNDAVERWTAKVAELRKAGLNAELCTTLHTHTAHIADARKYDIADIIEHIRRSPMGEQDAPPSAPARATPLTPPRIMQGDASGTRCTDAIHAQESAAPCNVMDEQATTPEDWQEPPRDIVIYYAQTAIQEPTAYIPPEIMPFVDDYICNVYGIPA